MGGYEALAALRGLLAPLQGFSREAARRGVVRLLLLAVPTALLAWLAIRGVLEKTGGMPAVPLDDSYIHMQYAKNFARAEFLRYSPDAPPVPGATSLLWPALLGLFHAVGFRGQALIWPAWLLGFLSLGLLAHEAERMASGFVARKHAVFAPALVLAFGANTWFAGSGMEVLPLSWLLLRSTRRAAEWWELAAEPRASDRAVLVRARRELLALAWLSPLMRPEGVLATASIAFVLLVRPARQRLLSLLSLLGLFAPAGINWFFTGGATTTTMRAKWLPLSPYSSLTSLSRAVWDYVELLVGTLLNGEVWSALFLPQGSRVIALAALATLLWRATRGPHRMHATLLAVLALGILIPGTFECPLCNRLRYLWPFFPAWLIGVVALADTLDKAIQRWDFSLGFVAPGLLGAASGALLGYLPFTLQDLAASASAISEQQVSLGKWAAEALPKQARIGVNDTGAIAYFSGRATFDIVGLTTAGEAEHWAAGTGSRFEHYERLGRARLPTHFIVYPEWFGLSELCGDLLTERYVPGATILGGERMLACTADYAMLGSAEAPEADVARGFTILDRLDVADLVSERSHAYELFETNQRNNDVVRFGSLMDGARRARLRDSFTMHLRGPGRLALRLASQTSTWVKVRLLGAPSGERVLRGELPASVWHEVVLPVPSDLPAGSYRVNVEAGAPFTSLHYFSLVPAE